MLWIKGVPGGKRLGSRNDVSNDQSLFGGQ